MKHERQAVILAGGLGTRLRTVLGDIPKALAEVGGIPVLGHQLRLCRDHGFTNVVLLLGHAADAIKDYVGDGSKFGLNCHYVVEEKPLGTAGAVLAAQERLRETFLVMYCDTMLDVDLGRFWDFAEQRCAAAALLVHPNDHPFDSDLVVADSDDVITGFSRWHEEQPLLRNLASAALYILKKDMLQSVEPREDVFDFGRHVFPELVARGEKLFAYRSVEYIKDLGTPERLARVNHDLAIGRVAPSRSGRPRAAVFLDRDGVLNVEHDGVLEPAAMQLLPGSAEGVRKLNKAGLATVVVTNQPYISHGKLSEEGLDAIHASMERELARDHAFVDAIYYCPHHPHSGYEGERKELKIECECRKPKPGMLLRAARDLHLDLSRSWMIGDRTADIEAARRAGVTSVLVRSGHGGRDNVSPAKPDFIFSDLEEAANFITDAYPAMASWCQHYTESKPVAGQCIFVGGLSRAGKTTLSQVLREQIEKSGHSVVVLHLDDWLNDIEQQGDNVLERYDLSGLRTALAQLKAAGNAGTLQIPVYDRAARKRVGYQTIATKPDTVLIVEGGPALELATESDLRLFVPIDENIRKARFDQFYYWRGEADKSATFWASRSKDEVPVILSLAEQATTVPQFESINK